MQKVQSNVNVDNEIDMYTNNDLKKNTRGKMMALLTIVLYTMDLIHTMTPSLFLPQYKKLGSSQFNKVTGSYNWFIKLGNVTGSCNWFM